MHKSRLLFARRSIDKGAGVHVPRSASLRRPQVKTAVGASIVPTRSRLSHSQGHVREFGYDMQEVTIEAGEVVDTMYVRYVDRQKP